MLILTRRIGESLVADDDVVVTVLGVKGNQVRIGVDAPRDRAVHREEVYRQLKPDDARTTPAGRRSSNASFHR